MLPSKIWGPVTWQLLHTLVDSCKQNSDYYSYKEVLFNIVKNVCILLPCKISSYNASIYFNKINKNSLNNVNDLINVLYMFHNFINTKTKNPVLNYSDLNKYNSYDLKTVISLFVNLYNNVHMRSSPNYIKMILVIKEIIAFKQIYISSINGHKVKSPTIREEIMPETVVQEEEILPEPITQEEGEIIPEPITQEEGEIILDSFVKEESFKEHIVPTSIFKFTTIIKRYTPINSKNLNDTIIGANIPFINDKFLPSSELSTADAILELIKDPRCRPVEIYLDRWNTMRRIVYFKKNGRRLVETLPTANDSFLPELTIGQQLAIYKIQNDPRCVPFDLYIKRWNELKIKAKYKKNKKL